MKAALHTKYNKNNIELELKKFQNQILPNEVFGEV